MKVFTVRNIDGKLFAELQLPHVFVAFPITQDGIKALVKDLDDAVMEIIKEDEILENAETSN